MADTTTSRTEFTPSDESESVAVDSVLILSFGGPEGPDDVMDFLRNVTRGRNVPDDRLAEVAEQYELFGGRSPINDQCRALADALTARLDDQGRNLPVYFGARNWHPFVTDTVRRMAADGCRHAVVFVTSAFGSYSGCRQYREDLAAAWQTVADEARDGDGAAIPPRLDKLRLFYNHPGFIEPMVESVLSGVERLDRQPVPRIVFTAHSIPVSMATTSDYQAQLNEAARLIMERVNGRVESNGRLDSDQVESNGEGLEWDLVFQSRSGPPQVPWLEPDVNDHLAALAERETSAVVVVPLGFTSDHMEVMFDLDTQAAATADELGLNMVRVPTVGTHPRYVDMIVELIDEIALGHTPVAIGNDGPWPTPCPEGHCQLAARPRSAR